MKKTWLTIDELALELQVSVKSIRRAYRKGQIPVERSAGLSALTSIE
jgi:hypothetical protein